VRRFSAAFVFLLFFFWSAALQNKKQKRRESAALQKKHRPGQSVWPSGNYIADNNKNAACFEKKPTTAALSQLARIALTPVSGSLN